MKLVLLVEGLTERKALPELCRRWLEQCKIRPGLRIDTIDLTGSGNFWSGTPRRANDLLAGPRQQEISAVFGLSDLRDGNEKFPGHLNTDREKNEWGVAHFQKQVPDSRFRMFFAVQEIEAWLLGDATIFPPPLRKAIEKLGDPERVPQPAAALDSLYRKETGRAYRKIVDGTNLFQKLDPARAATRCSSLRIFLDAVQRAATVPPAA